MPDSKNVVAVPQLGFWEKADLPFVHASVVVQALYAAITGLFRGKGSPRKYSHHVTAAAIRGMINRISIRQKQYVLFHSSEYLGIFSNVTARKRRENGS